MSEKVRTLNLTGGNAPTATPISAHAGSTTIGPPTLISSTFGSNIAGHAQMLTPTATSGGGDSPPQHSHNASGGGGGGGGGGSDTESSSEYASGAVLAQLNFHLLPDVGGGGLGSGVVVDVNSIMNSSQISATSNDSMQLSQSPAPAAGGITNGASKPSSNGKHLAAQSVAGKSCRFPKLEECAHFHYERVQLGSLSVCLVDDKSELLNSSIASQSIGGDIANSSTSQIGILTGGGGPSSYRSFSPSSCWFIIKVYPQRCDPFLVKRSFDNMQMLDEMLHRCVYDRKISGLKDLQELEFKSEEDVEYAVAKYLERFSKIASDSLTCGTILTWFQLDNKGRRLPLADGDTMRSINTPAVGAAYGVRRYQAQASDEISIEVGDMISVIDMPSPAESIWWRGKKSHLQKSHYEVGFFPQSCVATIGDKVPRHFPMPAPLVGQLDVSPTKPVLRKHGKLIAFFRSFILSRPSRRRLKQSGIYRERVFSCDLSEHLLNSGQEIPMVLKCCSAFIEDYGIVDGIYRLSGITSNIQRLRRAFDEERIPDLGNPEMKQDIHAVSSLLKMYFRELPNPLCTYQLYDNFVEAIQAKSEESNERLRLMKETVLKLPPPHYRTLKYLSEHLNKISQHSARTGMTDKNLAIVWAPNLLRSPALESGGVAALRGVGVQAVVTEYLIRNCHLIFDALEDFASNTRLSFIATAGSTPAAGSGGELRLDLLTDCESLLVEQREHDQSLTFVVVERPKSLSAGGPKLISLEEAQERHSRLDGFDIKQSMPINMVASGNAANIGSYIEVGGGPSSLPDKYHTVLSVPRSWQKRKTHSWKSLFTRNQRGGSGGGVVGNGAGGPHELKSGSLVVGSVDGATHQHHHKTASQVTFAAADAIITHGNGGGGGKLGKSLLKPDKTKSIEHFDTSSSRSLGGIGSVCCESGGKPMLELCVRSNSIDSLRTAAGHSRSVSHDSYFDLLQSPQRGHMTTCPSRELSELGLNFDREEPEMRIFSESESLVSSPRVGKENIPPAGGPGTSSRRILRARPEEFSSQTNSVNPSPKKQPRLNLLLSPSSASSTGATLATGPSSVHHNWSHQTDSAQHDGSSNSCHEHAGDESCCKRYKLEDQLSDIQFIDCSTPEHTVVNPQTLYTSVQIHAPPKSAISKSSLYGSTEDSAALDGAAKNHCPFEKFFAGAAGRATADAAASSINSRYSFPSVHLGAKRKDQEVIPGNGLKERFSYPGSASVGCNERHLPAGREPIKMQFEEESSSNRKITAETSQNSPHMRVVSFSTGNGVTPQNSAPTKPPLLQHLSKAVPELLRPKNRNSYCGTNEQLNQQLMQLRHHSAAENSYSKDAKVGGGETAKLSITPCSPIHSPRYSLLVGDTSSENSSAVNTPQYDLDPLLMTSVMSGLSCVSASSSNQQQSLLLGVDANSCLGTSHESLGSNPTSHTPLLASGADRRDMHALKRELSLDLNHPLNSGKMSYDHHGGGSEALRQQLIPSPNNSNFTDNTSQSVTPSEYGYQHLQRQSSMHSLIETEENSPAYEEYENTPSNLVSPLHQSVTQKLLASPIKSTISITYNRQGGTGCGKEDIYASPTKSPPQPPPKLREKPPRAAKVQAQAHAMLETSFDEHTVYEQVKFFRNSVTEVNQLLNEERKSLVGALENLQEIAEAQDDEYEREMHDLCEQSKEKAFRSASELKAFKNSPEIKALKTSPELKAYKKDSFSHRQRRESADVTPNVVKGVVVVGGGEDIDMLQNAHDDNITDSLESAASSSSSFHNDYHGDVEEGEQKLLYENVELRKPKSVYANMLGEEMKSALLLEFEDDTADKLELDSLDSIKGNADVGADDADHDDDDEEDRSLRTLTLELPGAPAHVGDIESGEELHICSARKSPSNFSVKELATKFETSPSVDQPPAFDFSLRSSIKKHTAPELKTSQQSLHASSSNEPTHAKAAVAAAPPTATQLKQKLTKSQQITRSLDENAFVREFGAQKLLHDFGSSTRSTQQLPELAEISSRRKSFDFTRPKTLNPPKRLPGMPITAEESSGNCLKREMTTAKPPLKLDLLKEKNFHNLHDVDALNASSLEHDYACEELKITPTTENRISLIQNNVVAALPPAPPLPPTAAAADALNNSNANLAASSLRMLSGVKLDRERIDKIKEERRQQLTQKYRADSFKSKSKTDLNSTERADADKFHAAESLRVKSKSRGDMRSLQRDIDNLKEFGKSGGGSEHAGSESTLNSTPIYGQRVRSISDEKNQNCDGTPATTAYVNVNVANGTGSGGGGANASLSSSANNTSDSSSASDDFPKKSSSARCDHEEFSARATVQKFERKSLDFANGGVAAVVGRERKAAVPAAAPAETVAPSHTAITGGNSSALLSASRNSLTSTRGEKISPQFSIRDVTAMFESRSQNQQ